MSSKSLLSAAGAQPLRSASGVVATSVRGFHVLRVDGFSVTTSLPGGECLTSDPFYVGGRCWYIDYYPNGADGGKDTSDAIALYLRLQGSNKKERVRADYKFSLLDHAGTAAYELPAETGIFKPATPAVNHNNVYGYGGSGGHNSVGGGGGGGGEEAGHPDRCGYDAFITKEDLERRRNILLREDSLAVRCDVAVAVLEPMPIAPQQTNDARAPPPGRGRGRRSGRWRGYGGPGYEVDYNESLDEYDGGDVKPPQSDAEYIRRCLGGHQR